MSDSGSGVDRPDSDPDDQHTDRLDESQSGSADVSADPGADFGADPGEASPDGGRAQTPSVSGEDDEAALGASVDSVLSGLEEVIAERDEYLDTLRRLQADFDNFRKRTARQQGENLERATASLLERLLPALDALDLALTHVGQTKDGNDPAGQALSQIAALLGDILSKEGLKRIDEADVAFDPTIHDAVAHTAEEDDDASDRGSLVVEVLRAGYELKGRVLRPAMVKVKG